MWCRWPPATVGPGGSLPKSAPPCTQRSREASSPAETDDRAPPDFPFSRRTPAPALRPLRGDGVPRGPGFGCPTTHPTPAIWAFRGRRQLPHRPLSPPAGRPPRPARPAALARVPPYTPIYARIRGFGALYERVYMQHISRIAIFSHSMCCSLLWFHIQSIPQHNCCRRPHRRAMRPFLAPRIRHIYMEK